MNSNAERIARRASLGDAGVERVGRRGVIGRIKADLGGPPCRGLRGGIVFALSSVLVLGGVIGLAFTDVEQLERMLVATLAGQWCLAAADVVPRRIARTAPALRILGLALLVGGGVGWWLA